MSPAWQQFRRTHHTSSKELADIANLVKPGLLVIYHCSNGAGGPMSSAPADVLLEEIRQSYAGRVVVSRDLDIF